MATETKTLVSFAKLISHCREADLRPLFSREHNPVCSHDAAHRQVESRQYQVIREKLNYNSS